MPGQQQQQQEPGQLQQTGLFPDQELIENQQQPGQQQPPGDGDLSVQHKEQPQNPNPTMMQEVPDSTAPQIPLSGDLQQTGLSGPQVANEQLVAAEGRNWGLC